MKTILFALAAALALFGSAAASGTQLAAATAELTISNVDPAANGAHNVTFVVWLDEAGTPMFAITIDGEDVTMLAPSEIPDPTAIGLPAPSPALPAPGVPGVSIPPGVGGVPNLPGLP